MKPSLGVLAAVTGLVIALDRWTKHWATTTLPYDRPVPVLGEFVRFTYTRNSGVAFGLGQGTGFPWYLFSIVAALAIVWMLVGQRVAGTPRRLALALILGGALGNLIDRLGSGEVVDFIEIGVSSWHWPVFNVADSAVSIGVVLFALGWPSQRAGEHHESESRPAGDRAEQRGATGPVPGDGPDRPVA